MDIKKNAPLVTRRNIQLDTESSGDFTVPPSPVEPYGRHLPDDWAIPRELVEKHRWLVWKGVVRSGANGKIDKVPYSPATSYKCNPTEPNSLVSFETAHSFALHHKDVSGLGFALLGEDGIIGGDLDLCIDDDSRWSSLAHEFLCKIDTYYEVSPGGRGLRFLGKGTLDKAFINSNLGLEIYNEKRFLTITGVAIPEKCFSLEAIQRPIDQLIHTYQKSPKVSPSVVPSPQISPSETLSALHTLNPDCGYHQWTTVLMALKSTQQVEAFEWFQGWSSEGSKYPGREECWDKWESFRPEGGITIGTLYHLAREAGWNRPLLQEHQGGGTACLLGITTATEVTMKKIDWIWEGMLAKGKVHMLSGNGGRGKTTLMLAIAALITRGGKFPNATTSTQPAPVIYISGEDSINDTLLPRFVAGDGDRRLFHVTERPLSKSGEYLAIHEHAAELELLVNRYQPVLLIIDPVTAFCGRGTDNNNATDIRIIMARLQELASATGTAVMALNHMTKPRGDGRDGTMVGRVLGSGAWVHASRLVWGVIEEESGGRLVGLLKSNLGPLEHVYPYTLCQTLVEEIPAQRATIGARANGECLSNYVDFEVTSHGAKTTDAEVKIRELLADGPRSKQEIITECVGIGERTLERVAKELGVHSTREGVHGKAMWELT